VHKNNGPDVRPRQCYGTTRKVNKPISALKTSVKNYISVAYYSDATAKIHWMRALKSNYHALAAKTSRLIEITITRSGLLTQ
jgi:hypothetical protein